MAFGDFYFPQVLHDLGLTLREEDLFSEAATVTIRPELQSSLDLGTSLATSIHTEKARAEFIIAPVLLELRRIIGHKLGVFSGIPLEGDPEHGLSGICDFLLTTSGHQMIVAAPLVAIVEAKNDNVHNGLGQCIATLVATRMVNEREGALDRAVYGTSSTGTVWKFMKLHGSELTIDLREYAIHDVGKILGVLQEIVQKS